MIEELDHASIGNRFERGFYAIPKVGAQLYIVLNYQCEIVRSRQECVERLDMASVAAILAREHQATRVAAECGIVHCLSLCFGRQLAVDCRNTGEGQA